MFEELFDNGREAAGFGLIPGLLTGIVKENWDQKQPGKVKVEYYLGQKGKMVTQWIPVMSPYVAGGAGAYFLPEVGNEVVVAFLMGRPDCPVVLGSLWSKSVPADSQWPKEKNPTKALKTKGGHEICFSDEEKKEKLTVTTPGGLSAIFDDEKKSITLKDKDGKNTVALNSEKGEIVIDAQKKLTLSVGGTAAVSIESNKMTIKSGAVSAEGSQSLTLKGQTASLQGSQVQVKADASLKLEASGITEVKGSMVKLN